MNKMKHRFLALLLSLVMIFSSCLTAFAEEAPAESAQTTEISTEQLGSDGEATVSEETTEPEIDASTWTSEDFTYAPYEKLLYGCDYSRQFTIKGNAITGFSESGEAKLAKNTDLVIPAVDDEGNTIVGIGQNAFKDKGLTSVKFPTGMMVDYDDTVTNVITKRGNFVIAENAFGGNKLTSVTLPEGVIAVLPHAFNNNLITTVKLPKTIWWIETMAFANNRITTVNFPQTCDFRLEMHGLSFAKNFIKSVKLPYFTEVVNKDVFFLNTGKEPIADEAKDEFKSYEVDGQTYDAGVVYMYTDNADAPNIDRIHHTEKETASQKSYVQKLIVSGSGDDAGNEEEGWTVADFTYDGQTITGFSESGIAKREILKDLVLPSTNADGETITKIAAATAGGRGLFGAEGVEYDSVSLPSGLIEIGNFAFQNSGVKDVTFPSQLTTIGMAAFQTNQLTSVLLPNTVTSLGSGAFATNSTLEKISLSKGLTEIPDSAFGCSDADNWMENLTSIELHEGITKIGKRAFAANNFSEIVLPSTVESIGDYAFSTKNYLTTPCTVTLNEGLQTIGKYAFRNKVIESITLPSTVTKLYNNTFLKAYSDSTKIVITKVYVSTKDQIADTKNFPTSEYHKYVVTDPSEWLAEDFTYGTETFELYPASEYGVKVFVDANVITGFSDSGKEKLAKNQKVVIPSVDTEGKKVQGIGKNALNPGSKATDEQKIVEITLPANVKVAYDDNTWSTTGKGLTERGDFFIGYGALRYNDLKSLDIPDGVIHLDTYAVANNAALKSVSIPKSVMQIRSGAFYKCALETVTFANRNDFGLQLDSQVFCINNIKSVQVPVNLEKLELNTFLQNTGKEPVKSGSAAEKKGGIVHIYVDSDGSELGSFVKKTANVHKFIYTAMPEIEKPWNASNFAYDEAGTTVTGLSESGIAKIKVNPNLVIPKVGPTGESITALGDGVNNQGIFVVVEDGKYYTPASVVLPSTLTKIGKWTFALGAYTYEATMETIDLPDGLVEIGQTAFQNSKLTSVDLPDSVTTLGLAAYTGSNFLTSIKLSASLTDIPANAFANVGTSLVAVKDLVIPEGVVSVGNSAFAGRHIETLSLPSTLQTIGSKAFENHQIKDLVIPASVTTIGDQSFRVYQEGIAKTLENLTLNEGLVTIGKEAFLGSLITELELPSTVVLSAKDKSSDCIFGKSGSAANPIVILYTSDESKVAEWNTSYANNYSHKVVYNKLAGTGWTANDFTYDEETATITGWSESGQAKRVELKTLVLPDQTPGGKDIEAVGEKAFKIPDDEVVVTKFGIDSPTGMTSVELPANVTVIGKEAFSQNALTEVDFTDITAIGERAFYGNDLTKAILPDTVTELGSGAFATNDITELRLSSGVTVIPQGAFSMNIRLESIEIPDTVTEIQDTAFAGARLTTLTIPESVTKIGRKAFHLHHLTELVIPGNVKEIGESAFEGTFKATTLEKLTLEEGVEVIGKYAFKEALLETVNFPNSIKSVGEKPFLNNRGKDGSHVVEVTTKNHDHFGFEADDTYELKYVGKTTKISNYKDKAKTAYTKMKYTGEERLPKVTVSKLVEGRDFTVEYKNNIYPGKATVIITGRGKYTGTIKKTFTIKNPVVADQTKVSVKLVGHDDIQATWKGQEVLGADQVKFKVRYQRKGGKWYTIDSDATETTIIKADRTDGKLYRIKVTPYVTVNGKNYYGDSRTSDYIRTLKKVSAKSVVKSSSTKAKVRWYNIYGESGYEISQSLVKDEINVVKTVTSTKATYTTVPAEKGTTYYYKVRAFKTVDGEKIYGPWSSVKTYKLK